MKPIPTREQLPPDTVINTGEEEVWWWDSYADSWALGMPLLMDLDNESVLDRYTHWLPANAIPVPEETE